MVCAEAGYVRRRDRLAVHAGVGVGDRVWRPVRVTEAQIARIDVGEMVDRTERRGRRGDTALGESERDVRS